MYGTRNAELAQSAHINLSSSVADLDRGSGIRCLLTPGSGMGKIRNRIQLRNSFWVKILKFFFDADPGWKKFGSVMEKIRIPYPQHC